MRKITDLQRIKNTAILFLHIEPEPVEEFEFLCTHPFLEYSFLYNPSTQKHFNVFVDKDEYILWQEKMEEIIQKMDSAIKIVFLLRKSYYLTFFKYISEYLSVTEFSEILKEIWTQVEFPSLDKNVQKRTISSWFKKCDKNILMEDEDHTFLNSLPDRVEVYRGVSDSKYLNGFSWTLSKEKAEWFAKRFKFDNYSPVLFSFEINKSDIFAYLSDRSEDEIIILPDILKKYEIDCLYL